MRFILIASLLLFSLCAYAQNSGGATIKQPTEDSMAMESSVGVIPTAILRRLPRAKGPASDYADVLKKVEVANLDSLIRDIWQKTSNEIYVYILDSSMTTVSEFPDFCYHLFNHTAFANEKRGALIIISPAIRKIQIIGGDDLKKTLSDQVVLSLYKEMYPELHQQKFYEGLRTGIVALSRKITSGL